MCMYCSIVPLQVLLRLSKDQTYSSQVRRGLADAAQVDTQLRKLREQARKLTRASEAVSPGIVALAAAPTITIYDCNGSKTLPGLPVTNPDTSADASIKQAFETTTNVSKFYQQVFNRNSIDSSGMTILSSVHFGIGYNNANWNGSQMLYGDGDGAIFVDFTRSNDVICHELTHGVIQHSLQLVYSNEPGGLNESMSDVFGAMFRQWMAGQTVATADWLIGKDIVGPQAAANGLTCLRDMASPGNAHCIAPQVFHYANYRPGIDPHTSSGIPNFAFYNAAMAIGGNSWDSAGQIWYAAMTGFGASPNMTMQKFADRTRQVAGQLFPGNAAVANAVDQGWRQVGL
ncbi:M4 family metallopeptidase (plasmid) [Mesorhizobium sp. AR10]|uniref:M4 family metallopeptidase n=1 Tax=Mesorhizobium sp. AR10 TaxID=2865839 RepID=UPI00215E3ED5|nr:M4 family metallopeptidase [Mesorhizobium sp. AR10]UVK35734.1 M4 family metallopeptidase [Mesorhizobium sp. AR10]